MHLGIQRKKWHAIRLLISTRTYILRNWWINGINILCLSQDHRCNNTMILKPTSWSTPVIYKVRNSGYWLSLSVAVAFSCWALILYRERSRNSSGHWCSTQLPHANEKASSDLTCCSCWLRLRKELYMTSTLESIRRAPKSVSCGNYSHVSSQITKLQFLM